MKSIQLKKTYLTTPLTRAAKAWMLITATALVTACGGGGDSTPAPVAQPQAITISGVVTDGPVVGGTLYAFSTSQIQAALDAVTTGVDRASALNAAASIVSQSRPDSDGANYSLSIPAEHAGTPVFLVFDNTGARDMAFHDVPANLESVVMLGAQGSSKRANVSLQATLIAQQVRRALDPDGDGEFISSTAVESEMEAAINNILHAFSSDALGRDLYPDNFDPIAHGDDDVVHSASSELGRLIRLAGSLEQVDLDSVVQALAADSADGALDGIVPSRFAPDARIEALAATLSDAVSVDGNGEIPTGAGPCTAAAMSLHRACRVDAFDDYFEGSAICYDMNDADASRECAQETKAEAIEKRNGCPDLLAARLELCDALDDAAHEPMFGEEFAENFIDPLSIGDTVEPNPWFPLVTGNRWVYEGDGETIEVVVTDETKLIDGITCVVIIDTAKEDDVVIEETRDWYAQDVSGNVWYCGEISRNFEVFEGDDPEEAELVDIDGSWKAGRDGAEPGVLLPFAPVVGKTIRQEVSYGEAEDVIEVLSLTASETSGVASCDGTCLQTKDFTPLDLDPDAIEHKFYVAGVGLIVEVKPGTDERIELVEFTSGD